MECSKNEEKQRRIVSISKDYGDGDLELSDSDENGDEIHVKDDSKPDVSYISKSDSGVTESGWCCASAYTMGGVCRSASAALLIHRPGADNVKLSDY